MKDFLKGEPVLVGMFLLVLVVLLAARAAGVTLDDIKALVGIATAALFALGIRQFTKPAD